MSSEVPIPEAVWDAVLAATPDSPFEARADQQAAVEAAAPLIVAANSITKIPDDVVHAAWHEYVYPLTAVERPMTPGFERAMTVVNQWLARRASVLRGEGGQR